MSKKKTATEKARDINPNTATYQLMKRDAATLQGVKETLEGINAFRANYLHSISPAMEMVLRYQKDVEKAVRQFESQFTTAKAFAKQYAHLDASFGRLNLSISKRATDALRLNEALLESSRFSDFKHIHEAMEQLTSSQSAAARLMAESALTARATVLSPKAVEWMEEAANQSISETTPTHINEIVALVIRDHGIVAAKYFVDRVLIPLLIGYFLIIVTNGDITEIKNSQQETQETLSILAEQVTVLSKQVEMLNNRDTFYRVKKRAVILREGPSTKYEKMLTLYPYTEVRLLERLSKWIRVEYYNPETDETLTGWVCKKYLMRLD